MSYTEYHHGKLKKIPMKMDDSLEQQCKRIVLEDNDSSPIDDIIESYDSFEAYVRDYYSYEYMILNGRLYEVLEYFQADEDEFDVWEDEDGIINYNGSFYNGGTSLYEVLENELKIMKNA